ncbi:MAG: hypothetical protein HS128_03560 [Ideonella sp.]|nr:hypothetical protein [Ideonella sp.]
MAEVLEGLHVDEGAMHANLERTRGLVFSEAVSACLTRTFGKSRAHALTEEMCEVVAREGRHLCAFVFENEQVGSVVSEHELMQLFDYKAQFGDAPAAIERVLSNWGALRHQ